MAALASLSYFVTRSFLDVIYSRLPEPRGLYGRGRAGLFADSRRPFSIVTAYMFFALLGAFWARAAETWRRGICHIRNNDLRNGGILLLHDQHHILKPPDAPYRGAFPAAVVILRAHSLRRRRDRFRYARSVMAHIPRGARRDGAPGGGSIRVSAFAQGKAHRPHAAASRGTGKGGLVS